MTSSALAKALLEGPPEPKITKKPQPSMTERFDINGDNLEAEHLDDGQSPEEHLREWDLNPDEWVITSLRRSDWETHDGETRKSVRYTMYRVNKPSYSVEELIRSVEEWTPPFEAGHEGDYAYIVALGDMQFGKSDADGYEGAFRRCVQYINDAADRIYWLQDHGVDIGHVHVAFLGDHVEGFNSQGGANAWRTTLPLMYQTRLTRYVMTHALKTLSPLASRMTMAAVPGNHGETVRFAGKGITTFDDSHDTEALVCVSEVAAGREEFEHVEFYWPQRDELTLTIEVAGLPVLHTHGHQFQPNKHFEYWKGQAFNSDTAHVAGLMLSGHLHHDHIERMGKHLWVGVGSMEGESTYYRHRTGITGHPGLTGLLIKDGRVESIDFIDNDRGEEE